MAVSIKPKRRNGVSPTSSLRTWVEADGLDRKLNVGDRLQRSEALQPAAGCVSFLRYVRPSAKRQEASIWVISLKTSRIAISRTSSRVPVRVADASRVSRTTQPIVPGTSRATVSAAMSSKAARPGAIASRSSSVERIGARLRVVRTRSGRATRMRVALDQRVRGRKIASVPGADHPALVIRS